MVIFLKFYLIGIKGAGMASLANILLDDGYEVVGSDVNNYIFTEERLKKRKVKIFSLDNKEYLDNCFIIVGHNFMDEYLIKDFQKKHLPFLEYNKFLSFYLKKDNLVCCSGSHGKTTLVGLLACGSDKSSFLRGDGYGKKQINEDFFFLEACEYQEHFLVYKPYFSFICNIDYDHVDYYKSESDYILAFNKFASYSSIGLIDYDSFYKINNPYFFTYGIDDRADFYAEDFSFDENGIKGKLYFQTEFITDFKFNNMYGLPLIKDVVGVLAFYFLHHYDLDKVKNNLQNYQMAQKRFNINKINKQIYIDDYAHHPSQMKVNLENVKVLFPFYKYVAIYKPDRISRLEYFYKDIKDILSKFDLAFICDFNDKTNKDLLNKFNSEKIIYLENINNIKNYLNKDYKYVFSLMSSKDLNPIKNIIIKFFNKN